MAVDHVGPRAADEGAEFGEREEVRGTGIAGDARVADAKRQAAGNARKGLLDAFAARVAVEEHPDFVTESRLPGGEVDDMTKQAADGRAQHMDNSQLLRDHALDRPPRGGGGKTPRSRVY